MELEGKDCICKGSIVFGVEHSKINVYYLLLSTGRLDELRDTLLKDMKKCPVHFLESKVFPIEMKEEYKQNLSKS